jgi:hypothetical protein
MASSLGQENCNQDREHDTIDAESFVKTEEVDISRPLLYRPGRQGWDRGVHSEA